MTKTHQVLNHISKKNEVHVELPYIYIFVAAGYFNCVPYTAQLGTKKHLMPQLEVPSFQPSSMMEGEMVELEVVLLTFSRLISTFPLSSLHLFSLQSLLSLHFPQAII